MNFFSVVPKFKCLCKCVLGVWIVNRFVGFPWHHRVLRKEMLNVISIHSFSVITLKKI